MLTICRVYVGGKRVECVGETLITHGAGFIVDTDGTILTNAHVVADMLQGGHFRLVYHDGWSCWGELLALDLPSDLALVRPRPLEDGDALAAGQYPPVRFEPGVLMPGEAVATIGSPMGLRGSVSLGVTSGIPRNNEQMRQSDDRLFYLQSDLAINPGNSGGPLITSHGTVAGVITTRVANMEGIAVAVRLDGRSLAMIEQLRRGRILRPFLGVKGITLCSELLLQVRDPSRRALLRSAADPGGILITKVHELSPASAARIQPGDVVTAVDGEPVSSLADLLARASPERDLKVAVARIVGGGTDGGIYLEMRQVALHPTEFDLLETHR